MAQASDEEGRGGRTRGDDEPKTAAQAQHSIAPDAAIARGAAGQGSTAQGDVPPAVARRYLTQTLPGGRLGFYADYNAPAPAFGDGGGRLFTARTDPNVIHDMVAVAEHRGWSAVVVRGAVDFRREAWFEANSRGLQVSGFEPGERDRQELARRAQRRQREGFDAGVRKAREGAPQPEATSRAGGRGPDFAQGVRGALIEVGEAAYQHRPGARMSPFVKIRTAGGRELEVWGVALREAVERSGARPGDEITLRREGEDRAPGVGGEGEDARRRWAVVAQRLRTSEPAAAARDGVLHSVQAHLAVVAAVASERLGRTGGERVSVQARNRAAAHLEQGRTFTPPQGHEAERGPGAPSEPGAEARTRQGSAPERIRRR